MRVTAGVLAFLAAAGPAWGQVASGDPPLRRFRPAPQQDEPLDREPPSLERFRPRAPLAPSVVMLAERPTETWSPSVCGLGRIVLESGLEFAREEGEEIDGRTFTIPTIVRYGMNDSLELFALTDALIDRRGDDPSTGSNLDAWGLGDLTLGTKWGMLRDEGLLPSVGSIALWKLPTADDGKGLGSGEGDLYFISTFGKTFGDVVTLNGNFGMGFISDPEEKNAFIMRKQASAEARVQLGSLTLLGEILWLSHLGSQEGVDTSVRAGAAYFLTGDLRLDASVRFGLSEAAEDFTFAVGVTIALGRFW